MGNERNACTLACDLHQGVNCLLVDLSVSVSCIHPPVGCWGAGRHARTNNWHGGGQIRGEVPHRLHNTPQHDESCLCAPLSSQTGLEHFVHQVEILPIGLALSADSVIDTGWVPCREGGEGGGEVPQLPQHTEYFAHHIYKN